MRTYGSSCFAAITVAFLVFVGCGAPASSSPPGSGQAAPGDACSTNQSSARELVAAAIDANQSCSQDQDCVIVALSAGCFDSCGRVMSASGKAAYDHAVGEANAKYCAQYKSGGCPQPMSPPCAPNPSPTCKGGKCG